MLRTCGWLKRCGALLCCLLCVQSALALEFDMVPGALKCIMEEIGSNVLVVADFEGVRKDNGSPQVFMSVKVRSKHP
jgi:hypothetical protein